MTFVPMLLLFANLWHVTWLLLTFLKTDAYMKCEVLEIISHFNSLLLNSQKGKNQNHRMAINLEYFSPYH